MPLRAVDTGVSGVTISSFRTNYTPTTKSTTYIQPPNSQASRIMESIQEPVESNRIPLANEPSGVYSITMTDSDMALTKRKFIKVSSVGEVEVCPDRVEFCVKIVCTKQDIAAARESVRKRDDFLMLALKKVGVPQNGISSTSLVKRFKVSDEAEDNDDILERKLLRDIEKQMNAKNNNKGEKDPVLDEEKIKVIKELYVICNSLNQYMELFSIVNEKLDRQVIVSPPVIRVSPEYLQCQTQEAAKLAMNNAIQKANQVLQSQKVLKATVGKLFYSVEDSLTITDISEYQNINTTTSFESLKWKRHNKLIVCKLTSLFEVNTVKGYRKFM